MLRETYQVLRKVGCGGMGQVFEARHARLPGRFAVKVLPVHVLPSSPELLRFRREAEIASSLRHPHIVQIIDFDQTPEGVPFLVMEFLDGRDLATELHRHGPLPLRRVVAVVDQVASAVAAAHGHGVIHRDLKPPNIFLLAAAGPNRDLVKVLDFGISKVRSLASLTGECALVGTPAYMAPEQARGQGEAVDGRSDEFALAAIAQEMLTGRPAFAGADIPATLYQVTHEEPPPLSHLNPALPPALDAVVQRALCKRKEGRFLSLLEFAEAFAEAAGTGAPSARPVATAASAGAPTLVPGALPPVADRRRRALAVALTGAAVAVGAVAWLRRRPPASPRQAAAAPGPARAPAPASESARTAAGAPESARAGAPESARAAAPGSARVAAAAPGSARAAAADRSSRMARRQRSALASPPTPPANPPVPPPSLHHAEPIPLPSLAPRRSSFIKKL
jgi:hypothetical protein